VRNEHGFATGGAVFLAAAAAVLASVGVPRSQQARVAMAEAAVIADLRDIIAATKAYKASNGALPSSLGCLGSPVGTCPAGPLGNFPAGTRPFLDPLRGCVPGTPGTISNVQFLNHGHLFTYTADLYPGNVAGPGQFDSGARRFTLTAVPVTYVGHWQVQVLSGRRYFIADHTGAICSTTGAPFANTGTGVPAGCTRV
jgi:type II secretory pathway pseudopilin PulG